MRSMNKREAAMTEEKGILWMGLRSEMCIDGVEKSKSLKFKEIILEDF